MCAQEQEKEQYSTLANCKVFWTKLIQKYVVCSIISNDLTLRNLEFMSKTVEIYSMELYDISTTCWNRMLLVPPSWANHYEANQSLSNTMQNNDCGWKTMQWRGMHSCFPASGEDNKSLL